MRGKLPPAAQNWNVSESCGGPGPTPAETGFEQHEFMNPVNANESLLCWESKNDASFIKLSCRNSIQIMLDDGFYS